MSKFAKKEANMSRSEFRWNKKRKHYAYLFKDLGDYRKNILLHSENSSFKSIKNNKQKEFIRNHTILYRHPNPNKRLEEKYYVENRIYIDHKSSFDERIYSWNWHPNDKRKIKRIKKGRRTR